MERNSSPHINIRICPNSNVNFFSIDVEEWFNIIPYDEALKVENWLNFPKRIEKNFFKLLDLLDNYNIKTTCFFVAFYAKHYPNLVTEAVGRGHYPASHSFYHRDISKLSPEEFFEDISDSKKIIEDISGKRVYGFRAPSFYVPNDKIWFFEKIIDAGYKYDSSLLETTKFNNLKIGANPLQIEIEGKTLFEFPISTFRLPPLKFTFGGGYFRFIPFWLYKNLFFRRTLRQSPIVFYTHPREIDPDQPRMKLPPIRYFRTYVNLKNNESKLLKLLNSFNFTNFEIYIERHFTEYNYE